MEQKDIEKNTDIQIILLGDENPENTDLLIVSDKCVVQQKPELKEEKYPLWKKRSLIFLTVSVAPPAFAHLVLKATLEFSIISLIFCSIVSFIFSLSIKE
jgi:hypothetical protein